MKPEVSERLLIEELIIHSFKKNSVNEEKIKNIERLTGDASTRRYYRAFCEKTSYVICLDNPSDEEIRDKAKQLFGPFRGIAQEYLFYYRRKLKKN